MKLKLNPEYVVAAVLFALFVLSTVFGGAIAALIIFYYGCFAIGWNIPNAARWIIRKYDNWKEVS